MEQDIKNYIILIALDNLISTYKDALDIMQLEPQERELLQQIIDSAQIIYNEMYNPQIKKPIWKKP